MDLGTRKIRIKSHYLFSLFLVALVVASFHLIGDNGCASREQQDLQKQRETGQDEHTTHKDEKIARNESISKSCNLFSGKWVYDNVSYPLYLEEQCSFMMNQFGCQKNGRKNLKYQNWRWQPHECDIPRFNGTILLEKIRGKRLVFVGDSMNRNQWTSMLCLIESSLKQSSNKSAVLEGNTRIFKATEYNATIEFYWSPFLVESNCDDPIRHSISDHVVKITSIKKHSRHWTDADILIFDPYMWWLTPSMTLLWGSFNSSDAIYKTVDNSRERLYEMGLNTWSDWLEININRTKTKLFFMSVSPYHTNAASWNEDQHCINETEPIFKEGYWGVTTPREMMHVAESVIQKLETIGVKVEYLNITQLSDYRKEGHPSIYKELFHPLSEEELANPKSYADCIHWCLPGVPDVWNEILYTYIINSQ